MPFELDYRPREFDEFIGNRATVEALKSCVSREDRPHTLLFQGPSGCGKTTLARIVAAAVGCPPFLKGDTPNLDFVEINAGNDSGKATARSIITNMARAPIMSTCRVFLLDEAHRLTSHCMDALLKPLEEPTKKTYFLLCTTEPDQLPITIRTRCTVFQVKPLPRKQMGELLNWVLVSEGIEVVEDEVREEIINQSAGCPRTALKKLDRIVDLPSEQMMEALVEEEEAEENVLKLCYLLMNDKSSWRETVTTLKKVMSFNAEAVRWNVLGYARNSVLKNGKMTPRARKIFECFQYSFKETGTAGLVFACEEVLKGPKA